MNAQYVGLLIAVVVFVAGAVRVSWDYFRKQCPWCHKPWDLLGDKREHLKKCATAKRGVRD